MPAMLFSLIDGVLGQVTGEQAETALRTLAPGPDGTRRYREAYPAAGPEELYELVNADWLTGSGPNRRPRRRVPRGGPGS